MRSLDFLCRQPEIIIKLPEGVEQRWQSIQIFRTDLLDRIGSIGQTDRLGSVRFDRSKQLARFGSARSLKIAGSRSTKPNRSRAKSSGPGSIASSGVEQRDTVINRAIDVLKTKNLGS